jgi:hypothetical protein
MASLGPLLPISRPFWLPEMASSSPQPVSEAVKAEPTLNCDSRDGEEPLLTTKEPRHLTISCPGLRSSSLPDVLADLAIFNPEGCTAYGPTARLEEKFNKFYQMPFFPTPTINGLIIVLSAQESLDVWSILGHDVLSATQVQPLPSWWHLPSDAVTTATALLISLYSADPVSTIQELVHSRVEVRRPDPSPSDTLVEIFGFSAGS